MLARLLIRVFINAIALAVAAHLINGIHYEGIAALALMALIFGVVNAVLRPIVKILTFPLLILTLGLFTFVINALMLYFTSWIAGLFAVRFWVDGFVPAFLGALVVSLVSFVLSIFLHHEKRRERD